jgi:hypothetical protein
MFWTKALLVANIAKVSLIIVGIYYVVDHMFGKYTMKHDRHMITKIKANIKKLHNMIGT